MIEIECMKLIILWYKAKCLYMSANAGGPKLNYLYVSPVATATSKLPQVSFISAHVQTFRLVPQ